MGKIIWDVSDILHSTTATSWGYPGGSAPPNDDGWDPEDAGWFQDVYRTFYTHLVYTAGPVISELRWMKNTFNILSWTNEFYKWCMGILVGTEWYHHPDDTEGTPFTLECTDRMLGLNSKFLRVLMIVPNWLLWVLLVLLRFVELVFFGAWYIVLMFIDIMFGLKGLYVGF